MSHSLPCDTSASNGNTACNSASKQTFIETYFSSQSTVRKRKRRNVELPSTDTESVEKPAVKSNKQTVTIEKDDHAHHFDPANDNNYNHFGSNLRSKVDAMSVYSTTVVCSTHLPDSDNDAISPSPNAMNSNNSRLTLRGRMKQDIDGPANALADVSAADAADQSEVAMLFNSLPNSSNLHFVDGCSEQPLCPASACKHQPKVKEVKRHVASFHKSADNHVYDSDENEVNEDVRGSKLFVPEDIRNRQLYEADVEFPNQLPLLEKNTSSISEDTELYSLRLDCQAARQHFMEQRKKWKNVEFYMNKIESAPSGAKIEDILHYWNGDYEKLERHHGYIQWLFPIAESGMNSRAQPLTAEEAKFLKTSPEAQNRMLRAYCMMLDFFGIELKNTATGRLQRAKNWRERMDNLNKSFHNYLRITRMLKCFGMVGLARLQAPFVKFLIYETFSTKTLQNAQRSCRSYWVPVVVDDQERLHLEGLLSAVRMNVRS